TGAFLIALTTRTGRYPSAITIARSCPPTGTSTRRVKLELPSCTSMRAGPGGKLASVTRPSASVLPLQGVLNAIVRPRIGVGGPVFGDADTCIPLNGP